MGYTVQWVTDHLGITRDMLRYYEKQGLLSHPVNQYRRYSEEELEKIWSIKLLISIGFSAKEIYAMMHDPKFSFYKAITSKVAQLEHQSEENKIALEIAQTIKITGKIPTVNKVGSHQFDDFMSYVRENWNFRNQPQMASYLQSLNALTNKGDQGWTAAEKECLIKSMDSLTSGGLVHTMVLHTYFQVIAEMQEMGHESETVQRIVGLMHRFFMENGVWPEVDIEVTPQGIARMATFFLEGDVAIQHEKNYGKRGCIFIAKALAYYGGYELSEL